MCVCHACARRHVDVSVCMDACACMQTRVFVMVVHAGNIFTASANVRRTHTHIHHIHTPASQKMSSAGETCANVVVYADGSVCWPVIEVTR